MMSNRVTTMEELERLRRDRELAFGLARDLTAGMELNTEDVLIVADWLLDGQATLALRFSEHNARHWDRHHSGLGPDAATWTPSDNEPLPDWEQDLLQHQEALAVRQQRGQAMVAGDVARRTS